jgi:hypothetical protein
MAVVRPRRLPTPGAGHGSPEPSAEILESDFQVSRVKNPAPFVTDHRVRRKLDQVAHTQPTAADDDTALASPLPVDARGAAEETLAGGLTSTVLDHRHGCPSFVKAW